MKVCIKTLGCKVNTYESEYMTELFKINNYEIVKDNADIYVVNTCTVTNQSDSKSKKIIRRIRRENPNSVLIVTGCFSEYLKDEISSVIDADIIIGNKDKSKIIMYLEEFLKSRKQIIKFYEDKKIFEDMEIKEFASKTRAFVKIEDGCENFCSYCIIPYVRGPVRSKEPNKVINEIKQLVKNSHKEVVLTGIHTGHYGSDKDNYNFAMLLREIEKINNLYSLRISSIEITELTDEILSIFKSSNILANHFHIPLQSGCDKTLKDMNRKYDTLYFENIINKIRAINKDVSITTDVIVGFPGETEEDFNNTYEFCKKISFSKIHVFPYSERRGTASSFMDDKVNPKVIKKRAKKLIDLSDKLEKAYYNKFLNTEVNVLIEEKKEDYYIGHTSNYLKVFIKDKTGLNEIKKVKIANISNNIYGEIIE